MAKTKVSVAARFVILATFLAAAITMLCSRQTICTDGYTFKATYKDWNSFQFFMTVNFIGAAYNLLVITLPDRSLLWKFIVVLDTVIVMVLVASCAATLETYSLLKNGSPQASWQPICRFVPIFCSKALGAIVTCIVGLLATILLLLYSFHIIFNPLLIKSEDDS